MSPEPIIRRASVDDLPAIVARWDELMAAHASLDATLYATADHAPGTYRAFVRRHMGKPGSLVLVAEVAGEVRGYLLGGAGRRSPIYTVGDVGMIFDLAVAPASRRQGLGRALVDAALAWFDARGLEHVQVNFSMANPSASRFWPALGFEPFLCEAYRPIRPRSAPC